jgi:hypothetical protein
MARVGSFAVEFAGIVALISSRLEDVRRLAALGRPWRLHLQALALLAALGRLRLGGPRCAGAERSFAKPGSFCL